MTPNEGQTATEKALSDAIDRTIARSSDRVKAACQMTTPSGADVDPLAVLDETDIMLRTAFADVHPSKRQWFDEKFANLRKTRTTIAALIARNAELEAERETYKQMYFQELRETESLKEVRNALAAENKALREAVEKAHAFLTHKHWWNWNYMEGSEIYDDLRVNAKALSDALARTPAKGNDDG